MKSTLAVAIAFAVSALTGVILIPFLRKLKAGQQIRELGPTWHMTKQGTPTMGGLIFIAGIVVAVAVLGWKDAASGHYVHLAVLALSLLYGLIGFFDDYVKVKKKRNLGLTGIQKLVLQIIAAAAFLLMLKYTGHLTNEVFVPFLGVRFTLPWVVYLAFAVFILVGGVNAVNLTDGIDGLAAGVTIIVSAFFMAVCMKFRLTSLGVFPGALLGALLGFLIFNFHPAKVFMGDTGSLFLGGAVCAMAFAADIPLILVPVGIIYIIETLSVILQVLYFKATHGKRLFKMSPIHHHFEMCGWSEVKIFCVFVFITIVGCTAAYLSLR